MEMGLSMGIGMGMNPLTGVQSAVPFCGGVIIDRYSFELILSSSVINSIE